MALVVESAPSEDFETTKVSVLDPPEIDRNLRFSKMIDQYNVFE